MRAIVKIYANRLRLARHDPSSPPHSSQDGSKRGGALLGHRLQRPAVTLKAAPNTVSLRETRRVTNRSSKVVVRLSLWERFDVLDHESNRSDRCSCARLVQF